MIKRIVDSYHRLSIRYTVFISFTLSALVAILMTGVTFYIRFSNQLTTTQHQENQMLVNQIEQSLYSFLSNMIRLTDSANFQVIKNMDVSSVEVKEQLQLLYDANNNYVKNISLFSSGGELLATAPPAILKEGTDVDQQAWFQAAFSRTENAHFSTPRVANMFVDNENQYTWVISLSSAAEITQNKRASQGVLLIDLKYSAITDLFKNIQLVNNGYVYLVDQDGTLIYHPQYQLIASGIAEENHIKMAAYRDGDYTVRFNGQSQSVIVRSVGYTGWKIVGVVPRTGLTFLDLQNFLFIPCILILYIVIIVFFNSYISNKLTDPIQKLENSVREIETGQADAKIYIGGSYEIKQLGRSIQQMVDIMRQLTHDIVEEHTQKQKSELNALQAQINPHFLYNTLDIIVWMIEKGQPEDALTVVSALAKFFRLSLSKGKNIITVRDELEHVRNYLLIQQLRYKNKFTYNFDIDARTMDLCSIKLVLQPIVENAVYYGMDFMLDGDGEITIRSYLQDGDLYLSVEDNGLGMPPDKVENLLQNTSSASSGSGSGIGIKNVNERIVLYFGEKYGVLIESEPDVGTCVKLHMPAIPYGEMEDHI